MTDQPNATTETDAVEADAVVPEHVEETEPVVEEPGSSEAEASEADVPEEADDEEEPTEDDDAQTTKLRREAATYRTKLRDAEAERDAAVGRLEAFQRQALASAATGNGKLADGADLWRDGTVSLDHLVADDGTLDEAALDETVARLLTVHPHWRWQQRSWSHRPQEALTPGASSPDAERPTWAQALRR